MVQFMTSAAGMLAVSKVDVTVPSACAPMDHCVVALPGLSFLKA